MIDELNLLEVRQYMEPCSHAKAQLDAAGSERGFSLSRLNGKIGQCVWCEKKLEGNRRRWCSEVCVNSAQSYCYPQAPGSKMHRLIFIQDFACKMCGESFEDELRAKIVVLFNRYNYMKKLGEAPEKVSLHGLGYGTGDRWQTDHIIPIFRGGKGIHPENIQVVCVPCHKRKTADERR